MPPQLQPPPPQTNGGIGFLGGQDPSSVGKFNSQIFLINAILSRIATATLVRVVGVTNAGTLDAVGFVDILPLVNQVDGNNNAVPHATIFKCPYFRLQGGADAIILDPKVGDIGIAIFADHDISSVTASRTRANPGSRRRFDMSDALYIGGVLNGIPQQFIRYSAEGIEVSSPTAITVRAPNVRVHASHSYAQDVDGYGQRITHTGGNNFQIDTYTDGAAINTTEHGWSPPEIP